MDLKPAPGPAFTALDGVMQSTAAACYLLIGTAAWIRAKRDIRTQVFLGLSVANLIVFGIPAIWWMRGMTDPRKLPAGAIAAIMAALGMGTLLLFHFTQVFPRRRPWIKGSGSQMAVAYGLAPPAIVGLALFAPATPALLTGPYVLALIVFGFPLLVLLGIVLPVTAVVSLVRSHREVQQEPLAHLKRPLEWILISQIGGGTLTILFAPVLAAMAPNSLALISVTLLIWALGLLTPFAFAAAVWKYDVLATSAE